MSFAQEVLSRTRPESVHDLPCRPERQSYFPSPVDWRDQVLYFLLVDRFSDGREEEDQRPLLDRHNLWAARPGTTNGQPWRWDQWAESGAARWQGGTIRGVTFLAILLSSAVSKSSIDSAAFKSLRACPVIFWSVCSLIHLARSLPGVSTSSSRLIVAGAPCDLTGLMAMD